MKRLLLFLGFLVLFEIVSAQESSDYGLFLGTSFDHSQTILPNPVGTSVLPAIGAFYRYNLNPRYGVRGGINFGMIPNTPRMMVDCHGLFEFNFLPLNPTRDKPKVSTFIAAGFGAFYSVSSLGEPIFGVTIPFDVGVKYRISELWGISLEWDLRRIVFQSVNVGNVLTQSSNWYSYVGVTANYKILKTCKTCPFYESNRKKKR